MEAPEVVDHAAPPAFRELPDNSTGPVDAMYIGAKYPSVILFFPWVSLRHSEEARGVRNRGQMRQKSARRVLFLLAVIATALFGVASCGKEETKSEGPVKKVHTGEQFQKIVENSGDRLLVFDMYADWCMPCRMLSPMLEEIAGRYKGKVDFYKVNVDHNPTIANMFRVSSIPLVVFVKEKKGIHSLTGVQPRENYIEAIERNM